MIRQDQITQAALDYCRQYEKASTVQRMLQCSALPMVPTGQTTTQNQMVRL